MILRKEFRIFFGEFIECIQGRISMRAKQSTLALFEKNFEQYQKSAPKTTD